MKILLIHPNDLLTTPTTIRVLRLSQELAKRGHQCTIAFFVENARRKAGFNTGLLENLRGSGIETVELQPFAPLKNTRVLTRLAKKVDIIHLQKAIPYSTLPAMTAAYLSNKPIHYDWDDFETELAHLIHRKGYYPALIHQFESSLPRISTTLTYSSEELLKKAIELGQQKENCFWLPVGADFEDEKNLMDRKTVLQKHGFDDSSKLLVYAGHLEAGSGAKLFIETFREVFRINPNFRGVILGGGTHFEEYKKWIQEMGLGDKLALTDYIPRNQVPSYLHAADINVVSLENTLYNRCKSPLKLLEAMSAGRPIVATNVGEIPHILNDSTLLAEANPMEMARKIDEIGKISVEAGFALGEKLQKRVRNDFSWYHGSLRLEKAYEHCLMRSKK